MSRGTGFAAFGTRPRYCVHQLQRLRRIDVADQRQRRVLRHVERVVEVAHVVHARGFEIRHAANRRVLVRVRGERLLVDDLVEPPVRLVVDAQPPLFLHDFALVRERVLVDAQRGHPVGLEPQHERQVLRRRRFPEDRLVVGRVGVALPADRGNHRGVAFGLDVLRALEHQVFEQMREARASRLLVLRAHVHRELQMNDRDGVILFEDDRQPVGQRRDFVRQPGRPDGRRDGRRAERQHARQRHRTRKPSNRPRSSHRGVLSGIIPQLTCSPGGIP